MAFLKTFTSKIIKTNYTITMFVDEGYTASDLLQDLKHVPLSAELVEATDITDGTLTLIFSNEKIESEKEEVIDTSHT